MCLTPRSRGAGTWRGGRTRALRRSFGATAEVLESGLSGRLFCLFLTLPPPLAQCSATGFDGGDKDLGMIRSFLISDPVSGKAAFALLQQFLKRTLVVIARQLQVLEHLLEPPRGDGVRHTKTGIDVDGAEDCLEHIGQEGRSVAAAGLLLSLAQANVPPEVQSLADPRQPRLADDAGAQLRQFTFGSLRVAIVQMVAHDQVQDRITEQFQALVGLSPTAVAFVAEGTMLQSEIQQRAIPESQVKLPLELGEESFSLRIDLWRCFLRQRDVLFSSHCTCAR